MSGLVGWVFAVAPPPMPDTASTASVKGNLPGFMLSILSPSCDHERRSGGDPVTAARSSAWRNSGARRSSAASHDWTSETCPERIAVSKGDDRDVLPPPVSSCHRAEYRIRPRDVNHKLATMGFGRLSAFQLKLYRILHDGGPHAVPHDAARMVRTGVGAYSPSAA